MDDLLREFLTEAAEGLAVLDVEIVKLEQTPNDPTLLGNIFRIVHTIKGTCGFLGLPRLEAVAHASENVLGKYRDGELEVTPASITLILESLDQIKSILAHLEASETEPEGEDGALIERLNAAAEGKIEDATPAAPTAPDPPPRPAPAAPEPKAADGGDERPADSAIAAQTIRVHVDLLENLMTMVSELVLTRNQLMQSMRGHNDSELAASLQRLNHVTSELQEGVMKTRMQPIGNAWAKLPRIVRDLSMDLGKKIELRMRGEDTELDRQVLELIRDPLTHMVRNSCDHGVEAPDERVAAGKPETGRIMVDAHHEGGHIIIRISDDGRGLAVDRIRSKALENGAVSEAELATMTDQQIQQLIFRPGFSTAARVTNVSGRGVGMDVVRTNIEKIGGHIEMASVEGRGSAFTIKIPLTLAIVNALIVACAGERFAIPQISVTELVRVLPRSEHQLEHINGVPVLRLRDRLLPLVALRKVLRLDDHKPAGERPGPTAAAGQDAPAASPVSAARDDQGMFIVVCQVGTYSLGIIVDRVFDTEEIVVKPVAPILHDLTMFSGNTILGDGSVIMILDPNGIAAAGGEGQAGEGEADDRRKAGDGHSGEEVALLLFRAGSGAPKAVPLSLVARLEELDGAKIEYSSGRPVVQYRDQLMPLLTLEADSEIRSAGRQPVIVFFERDRAIGLVVDEIVDIVEEELAVELPAQAGQGLLGTAVVCGKATDIIDVGHYLGQAFNDWFGGHGDGSLGDGAHGQRVLLVDDSAFFRNLLTPLLSIAGYQVTTTESGDAAMALCAAGHKFDVIVSDIEMPGMNGFELARAVNSSADWQGTPVVALSGFASPRDLQRGREAGFADYVAKFDRDGLLRSLSQTLSSCRGAA